jgi:L-asparaginase / beta-aspartyl-peptidase
MWAIIVHGGAKEIKPEKEDANRRGCLQAVRAGQRILDEGGSAVDAVEAAIRVLEDDPTFNAGFGSDLNVDGEVEMCSAIMDGATLDVGGVAVIKGVQHPISVAKLMLREDAILIAGDGARRFAEEKGAELAEPAALVSPEQANGRAEKHDTVGAVALDQNGNVAAGTSTGGLDGTPPGRVGDSPQPGCGYYAENTIGAVAFSGDGEEIARLTLAARTMRNLERQPPDLAVEAAISQLARVEGEAGGIAVDSHGRIGWAHNSSHMAVAVASSQRPEPRVYLRKDEDRGTDA